MPDHLTTRPPGTSTRFVTPEPQPPPIVTTWVTHELPAVPIPAPMPRSSYVDRSHGFVLATAPLAAATAFVVLLIGILAFGVPVLSVAALLLALGGFTCAWLLAYLAHTFVSPDGAMFVHVLFQWAYLKREQKERIRRYGIRK